MDSSDVAAAKTSLRRELLARRGLHTDADRARVAATLAQVFAAEFGSRIRAAALLCAPLRVVALYLSFATEPGTGPLIEWLADQRVRALAPTLLPDADLGWMDVPDGPPLGLDAITDAGVILVPALAVDSQRSPPGPRGWLVRQGVDSGAARADRARRRPR